MDRVKLELFIGDALTLIKKIPEASIDLVLTDPPFNVNLKYGEHYDDNELDYDYFEWVNKWTKQCYRVLKDTGSILTFCSPKHIYEYLKALREAGFIYKDTIIWKKANPHRQFPRMPLPSYEPCLWGAKSKNYTYNHVGLENVLTYPVILPQSHERVEGNPAQRPVGLYRRLIEAFSNPGDTVLDLFVGTGTTLLACRQSGRNGIGFELNPRLKRVIESRALLNVKYITDYSGWGVQNYGRGSGRNSCEAH